VRTADIEPDGFVTFPYVHIVPQILISFIPFLIFVLKIVPIVYSSDILFSTPEVVACNCLKLKPILL
jgi:hypothetical protein